MAYIKNWRDVQPNIAHLSAVHWGCLRSIKEGDDDDRHRLDRLGGFARHALQGRKTSDFHKHESLEQVLLHPQREGRKCCLRISVIP